MDFFVQLLEVSKILVMAVGEGLGAYGIINLMEDYGNGNPSAKSIVTISSKYSFRLKASTT